jgi:hypothetical protein
MGLRSRLAHLGRAMGGARHADGIAELHVGDPRFDDWPVVRDFGELEAARAWRQPLTEAGIDSALTADWPLDKWGRGDIALRVPAERWSEANELLDEPPP